MALVVEASLLAVPNGSTVAYAVEVQNNPANLVDACDVTQAFVTFCCPGVDGNPVPGPAGCTDVPVTTLPCNVNDTANCVPTAEATMGIDFPATGLAKNDKLVSGLVCSINVNPGVTNALAGVTLKAGYLSCQLPVPSTGVPEPALGNIVGVEVLVPPVSATPTASPTLTFTPPFTPTCAPTGTPYCRDQCPPTPTIAPGCFYPGGGPCIQNPQCAADEICITSNSQAIGGCCVCATVTPTEGPTDTPTHTATRTPPSPTATPTSILCVGDCDASGTVDTAETITLASILLGNAQPAACPNGIPAGRSVNVALVIQAVNNELHGCATPPPTETPTPTPTCAPTGTPYCSDNCQPCQTVRPDCYTHACGFCIQNPLSCDPGEVRHCDPNGFPIAGCCACATPTPTPTAPTLTPTVTPTFTPDCAIEPCPDLRPVSVSLAPGPGCITSINVFHPEAQVCVSNAGDAMAGPFHVEYGSADPPFGTQYLVEGLAAQAVDCRLRGLAGGFVQVDPLNEVVESNELNNDATFPVGVPSYPPTCTIGPSPTFTPMQPTATPTPTEPVVQTPV